MNESIDSVFRDYNTPGLPASGEYEPEKPRIRRLLRQIQEGNGQAITVGSKVALDTITPPNENYMGIVLNDPDATKNGYYFRDAGVWVRGRGFPDSLARVMLSGGTPNAQIGTADAAINPADIQVFYAVVATENTGPMTLAISGGPARDVVNAAGSPLAAGEWTGANLFFLNDNGDYQLLFDPGAVASTAANVTLAQDARDEAEVFRDQAEAFAGLSGPVGVYPQSFAGDGIETDFTLTVAPISAAHLIVAIDGVLQDPATYSVNDTLLSFSAPPPRPYVEGEENVAVRVLAISAGEDLPPTGSVGTSKLADQAVTFAKMQNIATSKLLGRSSAGTGSPEEINFTAAGLALLQAVDAATQVAALGLARISFSANKGGTNQTGVAVNTNTKVTFGTEAWDDGGYYDTSTSRFTPPAGRYRLSATAHIITPTDGQRIGVLIYKNGVVFKTRYDTVGAATNSDVQITCLVDANGDDYFEVYAIAYAASGTVSIGGTAANSWFEGEAI